MTEPGTWQRQAIVMLARAEHRTPRDIVREAPDADALRLRLRRLAALTRFVLTQREHR